MAMEENNLPGSKDEINNLPKKDNKCEETKKPKPENIIECRKRTLLVIIVLTAAVIIALLMILILLSSTKSTLKDEKKNIDDNLSECKKETISCNNDN